MAPRKPTVAQLSERLSAVEDSITALLEQAAQPVPSSWPTTSSGATTWNYTPPEPTEAELVIKQLNEAVESTRAICAQRVINLLSMELNAQKPSTLRIRNLTMAFTTLQAAPNRSSA